MASDRPETYALEWCKSHPHPKATALDIHAVLEISKEDIKRYDMESRVTTRLGAPSKDDLGTEYDLMPLANILNMYRTDWSQNILAKAVKILTPEG